MIRSTALPTVQVVVPLIQPARAPTHVLSPESQAILRMAAKYHPIWYIRAVMYLVGILHTEHHVSFAACDLVLRSVRFLFEHAADKSLLASPTPMSQTLTNVLSKLDLRDGFSVHPTCYSCHKIFSPDTGTDVYCEDCEEPLFDTVDDAAGEEDQPPVNPIPPLIPPPKVQTPKPILVCPIQLPSRALVDFFKIPGMFRAVNSWKTRVQVPGEMRCMQDGAVWDEMRGADGQRFFYGPSAEDEIRLGVTLSLDWFGRKSSSYGPTHSSGAMSLTIQNLPTALR
ncbi:hypothetical protein R3P38DRAFT_2574601 [Favolaschia claudopus]|uniref:Uncharacterized protein n=1 Tax=Favolaschia claudopus TaxID=2862362 RepID=A0AAV9ZMW5_9AGAR